MTRAALLGLAAALLALAGCTTLAGGEPADAPDAATASAPERVRFASLDRDPATGAPVMIDALLFHPPGASGPPRPAVVALHGCGGMYSALAGRRDRLSQRHRAMAELLVAEGYVVLFPDSLRSRGRDEICTVADAKRTITVLQRRLDVLGALAYLQSRSDVVPDRIALLGWSHGGSTVLATMNANAQPVAARRSRPAAPPYFRAAVAFYPGCASSLRARGGYSAAAPLQLFVGGADDWTAPQPCIDLARRLEAAGEAVAITVYPDTYHGFDDPTGKPRHLDMPNGVHPGQGVTVAPNPAARADAYARVRAFLARSLGAGPVAAGH